MGLLQPDGLWPPDIELVREQLDELLHVRKAAGRELTLSVICKGVGLSPKSAALISDFLHHKERGDVAGLGEKLHNFVQQERARDTDKLPDIPFCETEQAARIMEAVAYAHKFLQFTAVIAPSGCSKTTTITELKRRDATLIVLKVNPNTGANGLLRMLCSAIGELPTGLGAACYEKARKRLTNSRRCILVDNAHWLPVKAIHTLCALQEEAQIGVVICGIPTLKKWIEIGGDEELEQIASRVDGQTWIAPKFSEDDVILLLKSVLKSDDQVEAVLAYLKEDPQRLSSARRLTNALKKAVKLCEKKKVPVTAEILKRVFARAA